MSLNQFCKYMDEMGPYDNKDSTRTQPVLPTHKSFLLFHLFSGVADKSGPHFGHKVPVEDGLLLEGPQDQHGPPLEEKERTASVSGGVCVCACVCVCVCMCACSHACECVCVYMCVSLCVCSVRSLWTVERCMCVHAHIRTLNASALDLDSMFW